MHTRTTNALYGGSSNALVETRESSSWDSLFVLPARLHATLRHLPELPEPPLGDKVDPGDGTGDIGESVLPRLDEGGNG